MNSIISANAQTPPYKEVSPGVQYAHWSRPGPLSIHIVKFDYRRPDLALASTLGDNTVFGLATVRQAIAALAPNAGQPIAAINGDFFVIQKDPYQGDPRGLQISDGEFISSPNKDECFWIDSRGTPSMGLVTSQCRLTWPNGRQVPIHVNEAPLPGTAALLTSRLGPSTRMTNCMELVLEKDGSGPWLPLQVNQTYSARLRELRLAGNSPLTADTMVISVGPKLAAQLPPVQAGARLKISTALYPNLSGVRTAIGGGPALVSRGQLKQQATPGTKPGTHLTARHPRSAIGWNGREFYLVVVDGRAKDLSIGVGFAELAQIMLQLGCTEALNLDGGGSTTLWLQDKVANRPSDKAERRVGNSLVLLRKTSAPVSNSPQKTVLQKR